MFRLSGIFRDVYLWSAADLDLRDFEIKAGLADDYNSGTFGFVGKIANRSGKEAVARVQVNLTGPDGSTIAALVSTVTVPSAGETEVKKAYQNIHTTAVDAATPDIRIRAVVIDKKLGVPTSILHKDEEWLVSPLRLSFWRPPTNNDEGAKLHHKLNIWQHAGARARGTAVDVSKDGNDVLVVAQMVITSNKNYRWSFRFSFAQTAAPQLQALPRRLPTAPGTQQAPAPTPPPAPGAR